MMRQNTQPAEFPSPPPSLPAAAPPPLVHADVETDPEGCDCSLAGGAGVPGRRWEQSTASRRRGDISGVGAARIAVWWARPESRGFWPCWLPVFYPRPAPPQTIVIGPTPSLTRGGRRHPSWRCGVPSWHFPSPTAHLRSVAC